MLERFIAYCLETHDCVVVPAFGAFLKRRNAARVHPISHKFDPPKYSIGFNQAVKENDGLLENQLMSFYHINKTTAVQIIDKFKNSVQATLNEKGKIKLDLLGELRMGGEGKLMFLPNHLENIQGELSALPSFTFEPYINKEKTAVQPITHTVETKTGHSVRQQIKERKEKRRKSYWLSGFLLFCLLFLISSLFVDIPGYHQASSLSPATIEKLFFGNNEMERIELKPAKASLNLKIDPVIVHEAPEKENTEPESKETKLISNTDKRYYLIVASLRSESNVQRLKQDLLKEHTSICAENGPNGLTRIGYFISNDREYAIDKLYELRKTNNKLWLLGVK